MCGIDDSIIIEEICRKMRNNIHQVLSSILGIENPTLLDVISYFNNGKYPIYIMNRYDLQLVGCELATTDWRLEHFRGMSDFSVSEMKQKEKLDKKSLKLLKKMSDAGLDIYYGYSVGPLNKEDFEIVEHIKILSLKK